MSGVRQVEDGVSLVPSEVFSPEVVKWADRIVEAHHQGVEAVMKTCALVAQADLKLKGDFKQLVRLLPWSKGYISCLRRIGHDIRLVCHGKQLPADYRTLYHLSRLTDERFELLLENGTISADMKRNEASAETRKESKEAES